MTLASLLAFAAATVSPWSPLASHWSPPATVSPCSAISAPRVVFPSDSPSHATGAGAVVWSASTRCSGGEGVRVAPIQAGGAPDASVIPHTASGRALTLRGPALAAGAPHGQLAIVGSATDKSAGEQLIEGGARGPFASLASAAGAVPSTALTTAYLGDVAFATPHLGGVRVHVERFYSHFFARNVAIDGPASGPVRALTLALDYRSEALAVWAQDGAIYACLIPSSGPARAVQRIAAVGEDPRITALLSDDNRATMAWSQRHGTQTAVYIDRSTVGERFGAAQLLERFQNPGGLRSPAASPSLVRLSSESVMLAWAGAEGGHWVVRSAPVDLNRVGRVSTISSPGRDAILADLSAGPANDALLLWTEPSAEGAGRAEAQLETLFGAYGVGASQRGARFGEGELIAVGEHIAGVSAALDPDSNCAIVAWQGTAGTIEYSTRASQNDPPSAALQGSSGRCQA